MQNVRFISTSKCWHVTYCLWTKRLPICLFNIQAVFLDCVVEVLWKCTMQNARFKSASKSWHVTYCPWTKRLPICLFCVQAIHHNHVMKCTTSGIMCAVCIHIHTYYTTSFVLHDDMYIGATQDMPELYISSQVFIRESVIESSKGFVDLCQLVSLSAYQTPLFWCGSKNTCTRVLCIHTNGKVLRHKSGVCASHAIPPEWGRCDVTAKEIDVTSTPIPPDVHS